MPAKQPSSILVIFFQKILFMGFIVQLVIEDHPKFLVLVVFVRLIFSGEIQNAVMCRKGCSNFGSLELAPHSLSGEPICTRPLHFAGDVLRPPLVGSSDCIFCAAWNDFGRLTNLDLSPYHAQIVMATTHVSFLVRGLPTRIKI